MVIVETTEDTIWWDDDKKQKIVIPKGTEATLIDRDVVKEFSEDDFYRMRALFRNIYEDKKGYFFKLAGKWRWLDADRYKVKEAVNAAAS